MSFLWPVMLVLLLIVPLLVGLHARLQQRRRQLAARHGGFGAPQGAPRRRNAPLALSLAGLTILLTALARPQMALSLPRVEGTVVLAFDVSGSMAADDVQPNRMEAAKAAAREFVRRQPATVQFGLVAFSEGGFAVQAPTNDQAAIMAAIERVSPQRGTSLGQGILAALNVLVPGAGQPTLPGLTPTPTPAPVAPGSSRSLAIVLLSDGENTGPPDPFEAAQTAADRGVRIYPVGIGSAAGATLKLDGFTIHTQLDEAALQRIAEQTRGVYYSPQAQADVHTVYKDIDLQLVIEPDQMEVTALLAGVGLLILLIGCMWSLLWFGRVV